MKLKIDVLKALHIYGKVLQTENKQIRGKRIPLSKTPFPSVLGLGTELGWETNRLEHPLQEFPGNGIISLVQVGQISEGI